MAYTSVTDVQVRLMRDLTEAETAAAGVWIDDLEAEIEHKVTGGLAAAIAAGTVLEATVRRVVSQAVRRVLLNPEGLRIRSSSIDDYQSSATVDTALSSGQLYLTEEEWSLLLPGTSGEAFTISPYWLPQ